MVAAQPPWLFLAGAGVLWLGDSIDVLDLGVAVAQLAAGLLGARAVWRLTHSAAASALSAPLAVLTPWAVHEHGPLTRDVLAVLLPLAITGGVLALRAARATRTCGRRRGDRPRLHLRPISILMSEVTQTPFTIPTAERDAWGRVATGAEVERQAARARRCAPGVPFSGAPFIAFVASTLRAELAAMNAEAVRCP